MTLQFEILARGSGDKGGDGNKARVGRVTTPHGSFDTPAFMPVGTRGTVKGILPGMVADSGAQIILANTYHLMLRPGADIVERLGGLHAFTGWRGPILTDSGGYQAYSMAGLNTVTDDSVRFKSIVDGSEVELTPERATHIQNQLGADIIMAFDDCPPSVDPAAGPVNQTRLRLAAARDATSPAYEPSAQAEESSRPNLRTRTKFYDHPARLKLSNERTVRWLERCKAEHARLGGDQRRSLFGIVQGGTDLDQRAWSADRICNIDLPGYAIGGVAVGEQSDDIARVVKFTAPLLPDSKPRYLMGVGYERDLLAACLAGVDMFDCVLPTRNGRNANAFTPTGQIRLRNAKYAEDPRPIQEGCDCAACSGTGLPPGVLSSDAESQDAPGRSPVPRPNTRRTWAATGDSCFSRAYIRHLFLAKEMLGPILVTLHNLRHFQRFMADIRRTILDDHLGGAGGWEQFLLRWPAAAPGFAATPDAGDR